MHVLRKAKEKLRMLAQEVCTFVYIPRMHARVTLKSRKTSGDCKATGLINRGTHRLGYCIIYIIGNSTVYTIYQFPNALIKS